jgi:hypothetical protein
MVNFENNRLSKINQKKFESDKLQSTMTFQPHINSKSVCRESVFQDKRFIEKLITTKQTNLSKLKDQAMEAEKEKCPFQPEINKISAEIANRTMQISHCDLSVSGIQGSSRFEQLYENSKQKEERLKH